MSAGKRHGGPWPIAFDTTGLEREGDAPSWIDPSTGHGVSVSVKEGPPFNAAWMSDEASLRRGFAGMFAPLGCLIEAELVPFGGARAVRQVMKMPHPRYEHGTIFATVFTLTKATRYAQITAFAAEGGPNQYTGIRETVVAAKLGIPADGPSHPYDPGLSSLLPFNRSDDAAFDAQFPEHPLTWVRAAGRHIHATAVVAPEYAGLPELAPPGGTR
ncbi:hypothetical protein [Phytomonospora endophytica]|uniref:Uncharacterized protein n=1 Tax=Phytomonospora endophytica TaxID=714109 RepID=A0A841FFP4_9ACTN|nr:hypothetical protein [Phytomonospora endophytica]MBB6032658.1 hypothetical protein [Phytomonospora endophytica]GIG66192.1 hypothetical protein Pen01_24870 [Phytomonospora endophytica]